MFALHVIETPGGKGCVQIIKRGDRHGRHKEALTQIINLVFNIPFFPASAGVAELRIKAVETFKTRKSIRFAFTVPEAGHGWREIVKAKKRRNTPEKAKADVEPPE